MNQQALASACGVNQSMISDYERDAALFGADILVKMASALETTMDSIMLGKPTQDEANLLAWYRACGPHERAALLTTAKAMAGSKQEQADPPGPIWEPKDMKLKDISEQRRPERQSKDKKGQK